MNTIRLRRDRKDDWDVVHYCGPMNEETGIHLLGLYESVGRRCVFNFRELESINSKGVANWMDFIRSFREGRTVAYEECPDCLVIQMNMIPSLVLDVNVRSVFASLVCTQCPQRTTRIVSLVDSPAAIPRVNCDKCHGVMELEEDPEDYFRFLER